jgi:replicative DNA helicase
MSTVVPFPPKSKSAADVEIETEQAVLGSCFRRPEMLDEILSICPPDEFYYSPHAGIADCIHETRKAGLPITPLIIAAKLTYDPDFVEAGGPRPGGRHQNPLP